MKTCRVCNISKDLDQFYKVIVNKDGYDNRCKECSKLYSKEYYNRPGVKEHHRQVVENYQKTHKEYLSKKRKEYEEKNKEKRKKKQQEYLINNPDKRKDTLKKYRLNNKENILKQQKQYRINNKDKIAEYMRHRINTDPIFKLKCRVSKSVWYAINSNKGSKAGKSFFKNVDYTLQELKEHIEAQFLPEMTWDNYGSYWHIHHITPQASFNFTSMDDIEFKECWALENIMPLEKNTNLKLGQLYRDCIHKIKEAVIPEMYITGKSRLPWALEAMTIQGAKKVLRNKQLINS